MEFRKKFVINAAFFAVILLIGFAAYKYVLPILVPFIIGLIIAMIVHIPMKYIPVKKPKAKRLISAGFCTVFFLMIGALLTLFGAGIVSEIKNTAQNLPDLFRDTIYPLFSQLAIEIKDILSPFGPEVTEWIMNLGKSIVNSLGQFATDLSAGAVKLVASGAVSIPNLIIQIIIVVVSAYYIAADYDLVLSFLVKLIPEKKRGVALDTLKYAKTAVVVFIKSYSILFFLTFTELLIGLLLLRIPYAPIIAFAIALFDLMPILGTGGILLPWTIILLVLGNYPLALGILALYIVITAVRNAVEPRIIGDQIGLHPLATLVAMMLGLGLFGIIGMMLFPVGLVAITNMKKTKQETEDAPAEETPDNSTVEKEN